MTQNVNLNMDEAEGIVIDFGALFRALIRNVSFILAFALLGSLLMFWNTDHKETYKYRSSFTAYITNRSPETEVNSVATTDTTAAQALLKIYSQVLTQNETFLNEVLLNANLQDKYKVSSLGGAISSSAVASTQIMTINVTMTNPKDAYRLAQAVAVVAPNTLPDIIDGSAITIMSQPSFSTNSVTKNLKKSVIFGGVLGLFAGAFIILAFELLDRRVKSRLQLEMMFSEPVIGTIPGTNKGCALYHENKKTSYRDAWRKVRTFIRHAGKEDLKVIAVTAPCDGDGATTAVLSMAAANAELGCKVAVVNAALRGIASEPAKIEGVDYISVGEGGADPTVLLESSSFTELIQTLRSEYDLILVDLPACSIYPDAMIAVSKADAGVIVVRNGKTSLDKTKETVKMLNTTGTKLLGFIYNDAGEGLL